MVRVDIDGGLTDVLELMVKVANVFGGKSGNGTRGVYARLIQHFIGDPLVYQLGTGPMCSDERHSRASGA